jgi:hypothetical protein
MRMEAGLSQPASPLLKSIVIPENCIRTILAASPKRLILYHPSRERFYFAS